ncbi:MAG: hypothetical protein IH855_00030 [Bacteroidetes bacterium]|nr:hypothetical protein [Bacteroidota bacterium]
MHYDTLSLSDHGGGAPAECLDTEQVVPGFGGKALAEGNVPLALLTYALIGVYVGVVFTKSQVIS